MSDQSKRDLAMSGLRLARHWVDTRGEDYVLTCGYTTVDMLRKWRNRIWKEYGCDELAAMETEIDLDL